jgi:hypothetical protein
MVGGMVMKKHSLWAAAGVVVQRERGVAAAGAVVKVLL